MVPKITGHRCVTDNFACENSYLPICYGKIDINSPLRKMKQIFEFTCFRNDIAASYCLVKEEDKVIMKVVGVMLFLMTTFNLIVYLRKLDRIIFQPVSMDICFQYRHIHSELVLTRENCTFFLFKSSDET